MNIPNTLTVLRMLLVPGLIWLLLKEAYGAALWVFVVAGVSDGLDGFIAKKFNQCTRLGSVLDPLADKLLVVSSVVVLAWVGRLPLWLVLLIVARDLVIVGGAVAFYLRAGQVEMDPSFLSKLNTFVQLCLIFTVLAQAAGMVRLAGVLPLLFGLTGLTTFLSGAHYGVVWSRRAASLGGGAARKPSS